MSDNDYLPVEQLIEFYSDYNAQDIAEALFVSSTWLPNLGVPIRHMVAVSALFSMSLTDFKGKKAIQTYEQFREFLETAFGKIPPFPTLEDYIPELDWGEVKFHFNKRNYKIMYGGSLEHAYDQLEFFRLFFSSILDEVKRSINRDPFEDLKNVLQLQEDIITGVKHPQFSKEISLEHFEVPTQKYWEEAKKFLSYYQAKERLSNDFVNYYCLELGSQNKNAIRTQYENYFKTGKWPFNHLFIKIGCKYIPILPREANAVLLDEWMDKFYAKYNDILTNIPQYTLKLGGLINNYIKVRVGKLELFEFVTAVSKEDEPGKALFISAFPSKNKLILLYLAKPPSASGLTKDLQNIVAEIKEDFNLLSSAPITFVCPYENEKIIASRGQNVEPYVIVLVPHFSSQALTFIIPPDLPGKVFFLEQFLGIIDDIEWADEFASFLKFLEEYDHDILQIADALDKFFFFRASNGVLVRGAIKFNRICLDPHMGSNQRFEKLSAFWRHFPALDIFGCPRSWKIEQKQKNLMILYRRNKPSAIATFTIKNTHFYITTPFEFLNFEQAKLSRFLIECLSDTLFSNSGLFKSHKFFDTYKDLFVVFSPSSLIKERSNIQPPKDLQAREESKWILDCNNAGGIPRIEIFYEHDRIFETFRLTKNNSEEISLLLEVLSCLNKIVADDRYSEIEKEIQGRIKSIPRFKLFWVEREVAFPEIAPANQPKPMHYLLAKRRVAEIAKGLNLTQGYYEIGNAKSKIDQLRDTLVKEINSIVSEYDLGKNVPFLLSNIDALTHNYENERSRITMSLEHQVDYNRQHELASEQINYLQLHRSNRYLIEKFIQLSPHKEKTIGSDNYLYLAALISLLQGMYDASDNLHYGLTPIGVNITEDFLCEIMFKENNNSGNSFLEEKAEIQLGLKGNLADSIKSPHPSEEVQSLDKILDFLTLKQEEVNRIIGDEKPSTDLPVWEINKRVSRYTIRPLIKINDRYYWGPYSTMKTGLLWDNRLSDAELPYDVSGKNINEALRKERDSLDKEIERKTFEIVKRFTSIALKNVDLFKRQKTSFPKDLGDYDVLCYLPEKNVILNIECKHLPAEFCLKDQQRLRKRIFNDYLLKFKKRKVFLEGNYRRIMCLVGWNTNKGKAPRIISIFLTDKSVWWTKFPPKGINIEFIEIVLLSDFITKL